MNKPQATLIIAFYNNTDCLNLVFKALSIQSEKNFEVVIADDGSTQEAIDFINQSKNQFNFPIKHVWHEDKGFRKTRILNHAVLAASSDYLIFIDGDCIPQKYFIEDHLAYAAKGQSLSGRRASLPERYTQRIYQSDSPGTFFTDHKVEIVSRYLLSTGDEQQKGRHIENAIRIGSRWLRALLLLNLKKAKSILGCNFSLYKEDLLKVNGFDMRYEAPCVGEDTDVGYRLKLIGIKNRHLKLAATQLHMYHPLLSRQSSNKAIFDSVKENQAFWAEHGISELQSAQEKA